ncbi:hypothetical protein PAXRUDRAFT_16631 [Paxillus rubicundulus Ve08.2h10]|uniref:Uncharacterized protein n=1 Tax=Paxillus rubicundulus Ve08.2h10 TaxID=930991 RepID=A0A0D0CMC4_9AGAM|nr:hypothetical protein PAXRUDRAFT_18235 [Paxillus rubicundulus Ve08.2h10]KIK78893.1 hypothetical protein PAXRUDRAFT_16631 [Paxillus rubicundulus Ve08.2h10]
MRSEFALYPSHIATVLRLATTMADSKVTGAIATMLCTTLDSLEIELSLPYARYQKNEKVIKIMVNDKVEWSYKWKKTFSPQLGQNLIVPLSSTINIVASSTSSSTKTGA